MAITNVPEYPNASMRVKLEVSQGINQLQQSMGLGVGLYSANSSAIKKELVELITNGIFKSNPNDRIETLVILTNLPLVLNGSDQDGNFVVINIKKMLVYDSSLKNFTLTNNGDAKARVQIFTVTTQNAPYADNFWYGVAIPPSLYNDAFVRSLQPIQGTKNRDFNVNAGNNQKIYYCYPSVLGESAFTVNGFTGGFELKANIEVSTAEGPVMYYVYESDNAGLGGTYVTVSDPT